MDPGPYGCMPNYLSSVDPIFFLHHSNMDRLWDVWTRKQQALGMPILPPPAERQTLSLEPFLFFVDGNGTPIKDSQAGEFLNTEMFDYDYAPGVNEDVSSPHRPTLRGRVRSLLSKPRFRTIPPRLLFRAGSQESSRIESWSIASGRSYHRTSECHARQREFNFS